MPSSEVRQAVDAVQLSGLGSAQRLAQSLLRKASAAEVVITIGDGAVTYTGLTADGFEFRGVIATQMNITSLDRFTGPRGLIGTLLSTACDAIVPTTPKVEPISGTTAFDIPAPND